MKAECVIDSSLDNDTLELRAITSCEIRRTKSASLAKFGRGEYHSTPQNGQRRGHPPLGLTHAVCQCTTSSQFLGPADSIRLQSQTTGRCS